MPIRSSLWPPLELTNYCELSDHAPLKLISLGRRMLFIELIQSLQTGELSLSSLVSSSSFSSSLPPSYSAIISRFGMLFSQFIFLSSGATSAGFVGMRCLLNLKNILISTELARSDNRFGTRTSNKLPRSHSSPPEDGLLAKIANAAYMRHGMLVWRAHHLHNSADSGHISILVSTPIPLRIWTSTFTICAAVSKRSPLPLTSLSSPTIISRATDNNSNVLTRFAGLSSRRAGVLPAICCFLSTIGVATIFAKHLILFHMNWFTNTKCCFYRLSCVQPTRISSLSMLVALINFVRIFPDVIGGYNILHASIKYENLKSVSSKTFFSSMGRPRLLP